MLSCRAGFIDVAEIGLPHTPASALNRRRWRTRLELATVLFEYLEIFHNRRRRHSVLEMRTPIEFERLHHEPPVVA